MLEILTLVLVTYAYIVSSERSSRARATTFTADQNAPLPIFRCHSFGTILNARLLSTPDRSTSELLRTL